jgi:SAM-dependent methyltransferase
MSDYYSKKLSSNKLQRCYELAPPRVQKYLEAEISIVSDRIQPNDYVLELGCGYGRILKKLRAKTKNLFGIDVSYESLYFAREEYLSKSFFNLLQMNAASLGFSSDSFDLVFCIQNGISAFKENPKKLIQEAIRVTRPGGCVMFSSYSDNFWEERLHWFKIQSQHGLIGEIDESSSGEGVIVCKDGFKAYTFNSEQFQELASSFNLSNEIYEIDESSIFFEIVV